MHLIGACQWEFLVKITLVFVYTYPEDNIFLNVSITSFSEVFHLLNGLLSLIAPLHFYHDYLFLPRLYCIVFYCLTIAIDLNNVFKAFNAFPYEEAKTLHIGLKIFIPPIFGYKGRFLDNKKKNISFCIQRKIFQMREELLFLCYLWLPFIGLLPF